MTISSCNAGCKFCSNEITFTPSGPYLKYDGRLARVKEFALTSGVEKIAYTGGEPTLNPQRLYDLMAAMNPGFRRARLHTNGFGLFKNVTGAQHGEQLLDALISVGLTGVSVSVAHFDADVNRGIMRLPRSWTGMTPQTLADVATRQSESFTPRLSCVMTAEGVNCVADIFRFMEWGRSLGYRKFIFRTCSGIPDRFKKPTDFSAYNDKNYISIESISEAVAGWPGTTRIYRQRKSDSKVDVFTWRDITFDVDESREELDPDPKIRRLNVMPDGVTYTSWIDPMSVLFDDDVEIARRSAALEWPARV